ncbi:MAG: signal recognition particle-docking protein FtsY [Pseudomonadota bacterium]|nr:signal recognition particle-docking protein FtsY [Pseudomonadota bacterium]
MSIDKESDEKNIEVTEEETKKGRGGLFGRFFGRQKPEVQTESEVVEETKERPLEAEEPETGKVAESTEEIMPAAESGSSSQDTGSNATEEPSATIETVETNDLDQLKNEVAEEPETEKKERRGLFSRLKQGLAKTRKQFVGTLDNLFYGDKEIDEEFLEELEEILLTSDLGVKTSYRLFSQIEEKVSHQELENPAHLRDFLQNEIGSILSGAESSWEIDKKPYVIMTIGVNGVGKTTTIGKLASIFTKQKKKVVLGAADTFRAAAVEQLTVWAERAKVPIIKQNMGADPAAVAFDTVQSAIKREADVVIIDTAGRLHTKVNLMDELRKIQRVMGKALPGAPHEVLLVLDANTGQNAITQAQMFNEAIGVTGLVMTKLDGTAKGGVIVGVCDELKIPVRYIGIGESIEDLRTFDSRDFVNALFDKV